MNSSYKITFSREWVMLSHCVISNLSIYIILYFLLGNDFFNHKSVIIGVLSFSLIFSIIPTILVHIQYLKQNKNALFVVDLRTKKVSYKSPEINIEKNIDEINYIQYVSYYNKFDEGLYSFAGYKYCKIIFKDKDEITVTCLMMLNIKDSIEALLKPVRIETTNRIIAFIY